MRWMILVVALLVSPTASAEPAPWIWASTCAIDWTTTYYGVTQHGPQGLVVGQHYVAESNPTVNWLRETPALMVGVGAGIDVATWALLRKLDRRHHRLTTMLYVGMAGYRGYLVGKTLRAIRLADDPLPPGVFRPN